MPDGQTYFAGADARPEGAPMEPRELHSKTGAWLWIGQILTGFLLSIYVFIHVIDVGVVLLGKEKYDKWIAFMESAEWMMALAGIGLTVLIGFHAINGIRIASKAYMKWAVMSGHSRRLKHSGTWFWFIQVLTGSAIAALVAMHMWRIHFVDMTNPDVHALDSTYTVEKFSASPIWFTLFYVVFLPLLLFHAFNGFRSVFIKLGIFSGSEGAIRQLTGFFMTIGVILLLIGYAAIVKFGMLGGWS